MTDSWLMPAAEVARALGRCRDWFYDHRKQLEAKGMPPPHPAFLPALMYPKGPMRRWIEGQAAGVRLAPDHDPADQEEASARMAARAAQLARGLAAD